MRRWVILAAALGVLLLIGRAMTQESNVNRAPDFPTARGVFVVGHVNVTLAHVSSALHVAGGRIALRDPHCATCTARVDHYNALAVQPHISGVLNAWQVQQCGTTATIAVASNANRRDIFLKNSSTSASAAGDQANIFIGLGTTGHVALTASNGWVLHQTVGTSNQIYIPNYQGPVSCIGTTAGSTLSVLEIPR